ncbi:MAG: hypothetical protein GY749_34310 [Desulfobacteraceae bacterium]|nr:hypothetical protein [Desulfobacteraceae bacterium]
MTTCSKCGKVVNSGEKREHSSELFCEDCYIDAVSPRFAKCTMKTVLQILC